MRGVPVIRVVALALVAVAVAGTVAFFGAAFLGAVED
jgi:hypothetical protein